MTRMDRIWRSSYHEQTVQVPCSCHPASRVRDEDSAHRYRDKNVGLPDQKVAPNLVHKSKYTLVGHQAFLLVTMKGIKLVWFSIWPSATVNSSYRWTEEEQVRKGWKVDWPFHVSPAQHCSRQMQVTSLVSSCFYLVQQLVPKDRQNHELVPVPWTVIWFISAFQYLRQVSSDIKVNQISPVNHTMHGLSSNQKYFWTYEINSLADRAFDLLHS